MGVSLKKKDKEKLELNVIRKCSAECYFFKNGGEGCPYFVKKQVKFTDACMYDMIHMKNYADSFASGDLEFVKQDASNITAMVMMQIRRMLEQVNLEGVTVDEPMVDAKGAPVWIPDPKWDPASGRDRVMVVAMRKKDHPLIQRCIQLSRSIGVNLDAFKLTPKSADEKRAVAGHVIADNPEDIKKIMEERKLVEAKFIDAIAAGSKMTQEDPVYKQLIADGEVIS